MAALQTWASDAGHAFPVFRASSGLRQEGTGGLTMVIPIGGGTYAEGLLLRVAVPDFFSRISRRRSGWAHPWPQIERVLVRSNQRLADELSLLVVRALQEGRVQERRAVSSGRLEDALLDRRNQVNTGRRFGVGNAAWLNRSQAKYWRQIDSGFSGHVGREVYGAWMSTSGKYYRSMQGRRSDRFVPRVRGMKAVSRKAVTSRKDRIGLENSFAANIGKMTIQRPIEPQQYFARGWQAFNPKARALSALREAISEVLGIDMRGVPRTWDATVGTMTR